MKFKLNTFSLFYGVFFISLSLFILLAYVKYQEVKSSVHQEQKSSVLLLKYNIHDNLRHYESILKLLGNRLLNNNLYKNKLKTKKLLDTLLKENPELLGFGLIDIKGDFIALSSNIDKNKMGNIKSKHVTKLSFHEALQSNRMVLGRTYKIDKLNTVVLPLRIAIYNEKGAVVAVMTTGINISKKNFFSYKEDTVTVVTKDYDSEHKMYNIYQNDPQDSMQEYYKEAVFQKVINSISNYIYQKYHITLDDVRKAKESTDVYIFEVENKNHIKMIGGLIYNSEYKIFLAQYKLHSLIFDNFLKSISIYFLLFILSQIIFYIFFTYINRLIKKQENTLKFQLLHDNLTGLPNLNYLHQNYENFTKKNKKFELLYIDLDHFKNINDNYGHDIGDKILVEVANRLKKLTDEKSLLLRQGGDEFIILKEQNNKSIDTFYIQIIELLSNRYFISNSEFKLGASIGIAKYPQDAKSIVELLSLSDMAMYEAKKKRNSYFLYCDSLKLSQNRKVAIDQELREAVNKDEIFMVYQPQINNDGSLYGVEALVRWKNENLGVVTPDEFIPIAEETNQIITLGDFICSQSLQEIATIQKNLQVNFHLSINLSVKQLLSEHFLDDIDKSVTVFKGKFHLITFEITERLFIEDINAVLPILQSLRNKGFEISLDDFGTGYSSLSMLRELPINELKIDKAFVDEILLNTNAKILSKTIINMGQGMSMKIVAEGVETIEQVNLLKAQNCDIFQGYYFSKPLTKEQLIAFIQH